MLSASLLGQILSHPRATGAIAPASPALAARLRARFPGLLVLRGDARYLPALLEEAGCPGPVDAVASSLPLLSLPAPARSAILAAVAQVLAPDGCLVQYTYGLRSPVPLEERRTHGWQVEPRGTVWANVPPARVFRYTRPQP